MSAPMVRALLDGIKTQTRRVVKLREFHRSDTPGYDFIFRDRRLLWNDYRERDLLAKVSPYGVVGDRLWVKETFQLREPDRAGRHVLVPQGHDVSRVLRLRANYRADAENVLPWRPSIFMPRWASRITLEITDVRVQRLHDISEMDALAEGCHGLVPAPGHTDRSHTPRGRYAKLWNDINGEGSWALNPWVWALTFKVLTPSTASR